MKSRPAKSKPIKTPTSENLSFAITKTAVAQICQTVGFKAAQHSSLETLADITTRYLRALGGAAVSAATAAGRIEVNIFDIIQALEDLNSVQGYPGASNLSRSSISSSILKSITRFVYYKDEIPFAKPIPRPDLPSLQNLGNLGNAKKPHIPNWLPKIPEMGNDYVEKSIRVTGFGCLDTEKIIDEKETVKENETKTELSVRREKVRFKIEGVKKNNGVGFRIGNGKRVKEIRHFRLKR